MGASAFILYAIAYSVEEAKKALWFQPETFMSLGLIFALVSGLFGILKGAPFMESQWTVFNLPILGELHLGTPVLFDLGVYFVVFGCMILIIFGIIEE